MGNKCSYAFFGLMLLVRKAFVEMVRCKVKVRWAHKQLVVGVEELAAAVAGLVPLVQVFEEYVVDYK
jgi:hypothetical protein